MSAQSQFTEATFRALTGRMAKVYAGRARAAAAKLGVAPPAWAALPDSEAQREVSHVARTGVPQVLSDWCKRAGGAFRFNASGVTLTVWREAERYQATFDSLEAAIAAVTSGRVNWKTCRPREKA